MDKEIMEFLKEFKNDINDKFEKIDGSINELKVQVKENTLILKALEHSAEVNKSEHDKMMNDIAHIKGDVEAIKKDLYRVEEATANNWADIARLKAVK